MRPDPVSDTSEGLAAAEQEDIRRAKSGDPDAFEALVRRHQQMVFAVCARMLGDAHDAEDVAQDVFVRAFEGLGGFGGRSKLSTWLVAIAMNLCRNRRRAHARRRAHVSASLDDPADEEGKATLGDRVADASPGPAERAQESEGRALLLQAIGRLDEEQRIVLVLRDLQGMRYDEIATVLRCPEGTVKSRINRARLSLRDLLRGRL